MAKEEKQPTSFTQTFRDVSGKLVDTYLPQKEETKKEDEPTDKKEKPKEK